jgi:hypothetical protein
LFTAEVNKHLALVRTILFIFIFFCFEGCNF